MKYWLLSLFISLASAAEFKTRQLRFKFSGITQTEIQLYRCVAVEALAYSHLDSLGAQNISTICKGGLETLGPIELDLTFDVQVSSDNRRSEVLVMREKGEEQNCDLNVALIDSLLLEFPKIKILEKRTACLNSQTKWLYVLRIPN